MQDWRENKLTFGILAIPASAWLLIFFSVPLVIVWVYSFGERGPLGQTLLTFSLENYKHALQPLPLGIIWKSVWIATVVTVACLTLGFPMATAIAFAPSHRKNALLLVVILPFWTNLLIRTFAWIAVLRPTGFLNSGLEWVHDTANGVFAAVGLGATLGPFQPLDLLYNQWAVIIGLVYVHIPFMILPLYASLEKLDKSYIEASLDLGANQLRTFSSITVPLCSAGIVSGCILVFILAVGNFVVADILGGSTNTMIGNLIARAFGPARNWPYGSALSFVLLYATFLFLWIRAAAAGRSAARTTG
jgi:spermidine/putrescine transport system permease protein